jgi:hypothetical protein
MAYPETPLTYNKIVQDLAGPGSGSNDIYWVNAAVIHKLKPKELR